MNQSAPVAGAGGVDKGCAQRRATLSVARRIAATLSAGRPARRAAGPPPPAAFAIVLHGATLAHQPRPVHRTMVRGVGKRGRPAAITIAGINRPTAASENAPSSPRPSPPRRGGEGAFAVAACVPPLPPSAARRGSQASGANARRLRDMKKWRRGTGGGGSATSITYVCHTRPTPVAGAGGVDKGCAAATLSAGRPARRAAGPPPPAAFAIVAHGATLAHQPPPCAPHHGPGCRARPTAASENAPSSPRPYGADAAVAPAVHEQVLAGDVAGLGAAEEGAGVAEF